MVIAKSEVVWLKRIMKDLVVSIKDPILLYYDNHKNIHLARNTVFHAWIKHIEVHYHFIREHVLAGDVNMQHIGTSLQMVDIFTKALRADKLRQFMMDLGLLTPNLPSSRGVSQTSSSRTWTPSRWNTIVQRPKVELEGAC